MEILISAGLCALGVVAYIVIAKRLPIIDNPPTAPKAAGTPLSPARPR
jgi:Ni/Fe-hydrogenase subunit HybB-like protein